MADEKRILVAAHNPLLVMSVDQRSQGVGVGGAAAKPHLAVVAVAAFWAAQKAEGFPHEPRSPLIAGSWRVFLVARLRNIAPSAVFVFLLYSKESSFL